MADDQQQRTDEQRAKAKVSQDGSVSIEIGGVTFDDPDQALRAADSLRDVALRANTVRAGLIAEEKALVGSASHHYDRGASAAFHYDRRAAHTGVPLQDGDLDIGNEVDPEFAPGDSPVTGTSPESDAALERMNPAATEVQKSLVQAQVRRERTEESQREEAEKAEDERQQREEKAQKDAEDREPTVEVEGGKASEQKQVTPATEKKDGPSRQTPSGKTGSK